MVRSEQLTLARAGAAEARFAQCDACCVTEDYLAERVDLGDEASGAELAARRSLKAQIAKLDRELSSLVIEGFPHISPLPRTAKRSARPPKPGPRLISLEQLESQRDALVERLREAEGATAARAEHERRARSLLEAMQLEPGRYKFYRLRVADLGEGGCGVWQVRPRLGLIGMLAGWWQVKLSSGCPLARGHARALAQIPQAA